MAIDNTTAVMARKLNIDVREDIAPDDPIEKIPTFVDHI
jgi:hypothetical protein